MQFATSGEGFNRDRVPYTNSPQTERLSFGGHDGPTGGEGVNNEQINRTPNECKATPVFQNVPQVRLLQSVSVDPESPGIVLVETISREECLRRYPASADKIKAAVTISPAVQDKPNVQ